MILSSERPLTERDRAILTDLCRWQAVSTPEISDRHFDGITAARSRLPMLTDAGMTVPVQPTPGLTMWLTTEQGSQYTDGQ